MPKQQTNIEMLTHLMEFSKHGALMQGFVLEALRRYADDITAFTVADLVEEFGPNCWVSPEAWHGCAVELKAALDKHLER